MFHLTRPPLQTGFSVVELMVAMTLGLVLMGGVTMLAVNANRTYKDTSGAGQQIENGRFTMNLIKEDLYHAGFFGQISPIISLSGALPDACDTSDTTVLLTNLVKGLAVPIGGFNDQLDVPPDYEDCIDEIVPGSDILIIRRAETKTVTASDLEDDSDTIGNAYIQTGADISDTPAYVVGICSDSDSCSGIRGKNDGSASQSVSGDPATVFSLHKIHSDTTADIRRYILRIYYLRPYSVVSTDEIPTLIRVDLGNTGTDPDMRKSALVEGIEQLHVQYGLDDGAGGATANDGTPDQYADAPGTGDATLWANVMTARMDLLVRNPEIDGLFTDEKTYYLGADWGTAGGGDATGYTPGGHYRRNVVSGVMRLVNVSTRRECQQTGDDIPPECQEM